MKLFNKLNTKVNTAVVDNEKSASSMVKGYYAVIAALVAVFAASSPLFASTGLKNIFSKVGSSLKDIYMQILGISSVVMISLVAVCLIIRMVSKNQRSVEEATSWAKRIVITWLILNLLSFFLSYGKDLVQGGTVTQW